MEQGAHLQQWLERTSSTAFMSACSCGACGASRAQQAALLMSSAAARVTGACPLVYSTCRVREVEGGDLDGAKRLPMCRNDHESRRFRHSGLRIMTQHVSWPEGPAAKFEVRR